MGDFESLTSEELLQAEAQTWKIILSIANAACLQCAAQLGILDILQKHGKPMTAPELLAALPSISPSKVSYLHRLLRVLVHSGFLRSSDHGEQEEEEEIGRFYSLTPAGLLLQSMGRLKSVNDSDPYLLKAWTSFGDWFQNEEPTPFSTAYGENFWDCFARQPDNFNESMAQDSKLIAKVLVDKCKHVFEGLTSLVDVGGGTGTIAKAIAKSFPELECLVFDRPQVVANLQGSHNLKFVAGDMFDKIPQANAVLLKWILHDWSDEDCVKILKKCKKAIPRKEEGGKIIVIDMVMGYPAGLEADFVQAQIFLDMVMMMNFGSKERNKNEWVKIFSAAGFSDYKIIPALGARCLIELYP